MYFKDAIRNYIIQASGALRFTFVVDGLELLVIVLFVFIVVNLVVLSLFGCFSSQILVVPLYVPFFMYHLPKCHMVGVQV
jgi:hypothetical protein